MNAKKIMGAVLVALLAVTAFAGAGAAADNYYGTYFIYENYDDLVGPWSNEAGVTFNADQWDYIPVIAEGKYVNSTGYIYIQKASAPVAGILYKEESGTYTPLTSIIGSTVKNGQYISFDVTSEAVLYFTSPEKVGTTSFPGLTALNTPFALDAAAGVWTVQALFKTGSNAGEINPIAPLEYRLGEAYTFTIADDSNSISLDKDTILKNNVFFVTLTGTPGKTVYLSGNGETGELVADADQLSLVSGSALDLSADAGVQVTLNGEGKAVLGIKATEDGKYTISAYFTDADWASKKNGKTAKITVDMGEITAEAGADFYYLGNTVIVTGTNTESSKVFFYIKGNNVDAIPFIDGDNTADVKADKTWEMKFSGELFEDYDAGTYTIYAVAEDAWDYAKDELNLKDKTYASVSVALKQPFLTASLSSSVVAQDSDLTVSGNAEAAGQVMYYIFGNNKFESGLISVEDDGSFEADITIDADEFATGQYFIVVQHPMYDTFFNIGPIYVDANGDIVSTTAGYIPTVGKKLDANIVLNTTGSYKAVTQAAMKDATLFNTGKRQSSNAAEALCQALDTQNIDDLYVKATFVVAQPTATINPVDDVVKGEKLVVSGTSNMAPGTVVTVEILSTAFAAIPKESVNSASFIALTTKVQDDGTWEVTFDTTGLNVDEYTLGATVGDIKTPSVVVKVLESAPVTPEQPDTPVTPEQPEQPEQPTEPETPGFGALAALAGLGAVAVLLLRRE